MSAEPQQILPDEFSPRDLEKSDAELIRDCRRGDERAWDRLVERYQRLVFAIPRRARLSDEQAADILQEVFLTLFEKLDDIEQPEKIRSWMVTTAKFKTWAAVRNSRGFYSPETEEQMEQELAGIRDVAPLADEMLVQLEQQHLVRTALQQIDERCRRIISMLYMGDRAATYAEVAADVSVGESSISPLRARCLKKLEKVLRG